MTDRMTVIAQLGTLITDAVQRGDDRATETLRDALELLVADASTDRALKGRRTSDAERQRRKRDRESRDVTVRHVTQRDGSQGFPGPLPNSPEEETKTQRAHAQEDPMYELNRGLLETRMAELFDDARRFVEERDRAAVTWAAWYGEMLSILTGGTALPVDVAQVCRDDAALERRVGSPRGLRVFVANAVRDRVHGVIQERPPFGAGARAVPGARRENPNTPRTLAATEMLIGEGANE